MSRKEKLIKKLLSKPKDFTFNEAVSLLKMCGYSLSNKGKTSGSRVKFVSKKTSIPVLLHKPHPNKVLKDYQIIDLINDLKKENFI